MRSCVLSSPIVQILQPRKPFKYPSPPPSLIIKPSASNSPSHIHLGSKANRLTAPAQTNSTPEKMRIGQSLASEMYLGNLQAALLQKTDSLDTAASDDDILTVSIQTNASPNHIAELNKSPLPPSPLVKRPSAPNEWDTNMSRSLDSSDLERQLSLPNHANTMPVNKAEKMAHNGSAGAEQKPTNVKPVLTVSESAPVLNGYTEHCNGVQNKTHSKSIRQKDSETVKKSSLRKNFFENYTSLIPRENKPRKKVSFAMPGPIERDVSDMSISSHLSAAGDCIIIDDEDSLMLE